MDGSPQAQRLFLVSSDRVLHKKEWLPLACSHHLAIRAFELSGSDEGHFLMGMIEVHLLEDPSVLGSLEPQKLQG
jgi:hypothetical protein